MCLFLASRSCGFTLLHEKKKWVVTPKKASCDFGLPLLTRDTSHGHRSSRCEPSGSIHNVSTGTIWPRSARHNVEHRGTRKTGFQGWSEKRTKGMILFENLHVIYRNIVFKQILMKVAHLHCNELPSDYNLKFVGASVHTHSWQTTHVGLGLTV